MSKQLATLYEDAPVPLDLKAMDVHKFDVVRLKNNLEKLEFRSLMRRMPEIGQTATSPTDHLAPGGRLVLPKAVSPAEFKVDADVLYIHALARGAHGANPYAVIIGTKTAAVTYLLPRDVDSL